MHRLTSLVTSYGFLKIKNYILDTLIAPTYLLDLDQIAIGTGIEHTTSMDAGVSKIIQRALHKDNTFNEKSMSCICVSLQTSWKVLWNYLRFPSHFKLLLCSLYLGQSSPMLFFCIVFSYFLCFCLFSRFFLIFQFFLFSIFSYFLVLVVPFYRKFDISVTLRATDHSDKAKFICIGY